MMSSSTTPLAFSLVLDAPALPVHGACAFLRADSEVALDAALPRGHALVQRGCAPAASLCAHVVRALQRLREVAIEAHVDACDNQLLITALVRSDGDRLAAQRALGSRKLLFVHEYGDADAATVTLALRDDSLEVAQNAAKLLQAAAVRVRARAHSLPAARAWSVQLGAVASPVLHAFTMSDHHSAPARNEYVTVFVASSARPQQVLDLFALQLRTVPRDICRQRGDEVVLTRLCALRLVVDLDDSAVDFHDLMVFHAVNAVVFHCVKQDRLLGVDAHEIALADDVEDDALAAAVCPAPEPASFPADDDLFHALLLDHDCAADDLPPTPTVSRRPSCEGHELLDAANTHDADHAPQLDADHAPQLDADHAPAHQLDLGAADHEPSPQLAINDALADTQTSLAALDIADHAPEDEVEPFDEELYREIVHRVQQIAAQNNAGTSSSSTVQPPTEEVESTQPVDAADEHESMSTRTVEGADELVEEATAAVAQCDEELEFTQPVEESDERVAQEEEEEAPAAVELESTQPVEESDELVAQEEAPAAVELEEAPAVAVELEEAEEAPAVAVELVEDALASVELVEDALAFVELVAQEEAPAAVELEEAEEAPATFELEEAPATFELEEAPATFELVEAPAVAVELAEAPAVAVELEEAEEAPAVAVELEEDALASVELAEDEAPAAVELAAQEAPAAAVELAAQEAPAAAVELEAAPVPAAVELEEAEEASVQAAVDLAAASKSRSAPVDPQESRSAATLVLDAVLDAVISRASEVDLLLQMTRRPRTQQQQQQQDTEQAATLAELAALSTAPARLLLPPARAAPSARDRDIACLQALLQPDLRELSAIDLLPAFDGFIAAEDEVQIVRPPELTRFQTQLARDIVRLVKQVDGDRAVCVVAPRGVGARTALQSALENDDIAGRRVRLDVDECAHSSDEVAVHAGASLRWNDRDTRQLLRCVGIDFVHATAIPVLHALPRLSDMIEAACVGARRLRGRLARAELLRAHARIFLPAIVPHAIGSQQLHATMQRWVTHDFKPSQLVNSVEHMRATYDAQRRVEKAAAAATAAADVVAQQTSEPAAAAAAATDVVAQQTSEPATDVVAQQPAATDVVAAEQSAEPAAAEVKLVQALDRGALVVRGGRVSLYTRTRAGDMYSPAGSFRVDNGVHRLFVQRNETALQLHLVREETRTRKRGVDGAEIGSRLSRFETPLPSSSSSPPATSTAAAAAPHQRLHELLIWTDDARAPTRSPSSFCAGDDDNLVWFVAGADDAASVHCCGARIIAPDHAPRSLGAPHADCNAHALSISVALAATAP